MAAVDALRSDAGHRARTVQATAGMVDVWRVDLAGSRTGSRIARCGGARPRGADPARAQADRSGRARGACCGRCSGATWIAIHATLRFVLGPHGKPALLRDDTESVEDLRFNLSHSGGLALYAVTVGSEVGVDVEVRRRRVDSSRSRRACSAASRLGAWPRSKTPSRARTVHARVGRARGRREVPRARARDAARGHPAADDLWTAELDVGPGALPPIAVAGGPCELHRWEWRGSSPQSGPARSPDPSACDRPRRGAERSLEMNAAGERRLRRRSPGRRPGSSVRPARGRLRRTPDVGRRGARAVRLGGVGARDVERAVAAFGFARSGSRPFAQQHLVVEDVLRLARF